VCSIELQELCCGCGPDMIMVPFIFPLPPGDNPIAVNNNNNNNNNNNYYYYYYYYYYYKYQLSLKSTR
jgi:hypothetical protein